MAARLLMPVLETASRERRIQRVLLRGVEGVGRTTQLTSRATVLVPLGGRNALEASLRALLGPTRDEDDTLAAIAQAPSLIDVEPARAQTAIELLASAIGITRPEFHTNRLDAAARLEGAALELGRWFVDRAERSPLIVAFDDAHLATDDDLAFIDSVAQREEPVPLVVVVSFDAAVHRHGPALSARLSSSWTSDSGWQRVDVPVPSLDECAALLAKNGADESLARALAVKAGGNPGIAFALQRQVKRGASPEGLPASLEGLRRATVEALGPVAFSLCARLAALGGSALESLVLEGGSSEALEAVVQAGLVVRESIARHDFLRFADPRTGQALRDAVVEKVELRRDATARAQTILATSSPEEFGQLAPAFLPLLASSEDASFWNEAWAASLGERASAASLLEAALKDATDIRRLVLLRRLAEIRLFLGQPQAAVTLLPEQNRPTAVRASKLPASDVGTLLEKLSPSALDRWDRLDGETAQVALELVRAEALSHLVKKEETQRAFSAVERKLSLLKGPGAAKLWIRLARGWSWFLTEILGKGPEAMRVCAVARRNVPAELLAQDDDTLALIRAEAVATAAIGELARAEALSREQLALARKHGRLRDACLALNMLGLVQYGQGRLTEARASLEESIEAARASGWLRREAITLHNLVLVLTELGELDAAFAGETTYARLSTLMGNHAGKAEAPLVLSTVELARGRLPEAEQLIAEGRKVAEANGWDMLVAQARAHAGKLRLLRYKRSGDALEVTRARNDLMAAIEALEERSLVWSEELDPGELYALLAMALKWSGQATQGLTLVEGVTGRLPNENVISRQQLEVARALLRGTSVAEPLGWFRERGFARRVALWEAL